MRAALALAALALLAGCGRVGPPRPPGPTSEIIYPRPYPTPPKAEGAGPANAAPAPVMPNVPLTVPTR